MIVPVIVCLPDVAALQRNRHLPLQHVLPLHICRHRCADEEDL